MAMMMVTMAARMVMMVCAGGDGDDAGDGDDEGDDDDGGDWR